MLVKVYWVEISLTQFCYEDDPILRIVASGEGGRDHSLKWLE